jgi:hypothetical protein
VTSDQIIDSAIKIVLAEERSLSPGETVAHVSDPIAYEFLRYENGNAIVGWDGVVKSFPAREVFNPNIVKRVALEIQRNLILPSMN